MRVALSLAAGLLAAAAALPGGALAQVSPSVDALRPLTSVQRVGYAYDSYLYGAASPNTASSQPSAAEKPAVSAEGKQEQGKEEEAKKDEGKKEEESKKEEKAEEEGPWKLFDCPRLKACNVDIRGWIDQGFTWNPDNPADRFNGPVGYNDRSNEYELNQLYLIMERQTKTDGCGIDLGGRVDLLYGTDRRFVTAYELDAEWSLGQRFYGLAMPQMYGDLAINNLTIRGGHFLAPCGYESVMAPENFFYSHSYSFLYAQPTTLSGGELIYKLTDQWSANVGLDTGWNDWLAPNGKINYFGGVNWTSEDQKTTFAFEMFLGNTNPERGVEANRTHYAAVLTRKLGQKWRYALEHDLGYDTNPFGTGEHALWWSFVNYLYYDWNECWSFGVRQEFISDKDAAVVMRVGPPTDGPWPSTFTALALGANWKPHQSKNVLVRSEVRWDWAGNDLPVGQRPFDDGTDNHQFLWATDLIVRF